MISGILEFEPLHVVILVVSISEVVSDPIIV